MLHLTNTLNSNPEYKRPKQPVQPLTVKGQFVWMDYWPCADLKTMLIVNYSCQSIDPSHNLTFKNGHVGCYFKQCIYLNEGMPGFPIVNPSTSPHTHVIGQAQTPQYRHQQNHCCQGNFPHCCISLFTIWQQPKSKNKHLDLSRASSFHSTIKAADECHAIYFTT